MNKLTVVIVNYNVKFYVEQCLVSLKRAMQDVDAEVFVVDNHSKDGSVPYLTSRFPWVHFINSNHNLGFARANNIAIRQSESEYVLLLNPDTIVGEHTLKEAIAFMDSHPHAGAMAARMLKTDGSDAKESRRGLPTPWVSFCKMTGLCNHFPKSKRFGHYYMGYLPWDEANKIEVVSGAFFFARREVLNKVGLLDEDFFMYGEDIDLSYRIMKGGFESWYAPIKILHYKGESTQKSSFRYVHVFYDAMLIFFRKHYAHVSAFVSLPIKIAIYMKATSELLKMQIAKVKKSLGMMKHDTTLPQYIFIGQETALKNCQALLLSKGLNATFYVGDAETKPNGHLDLSIKTNEKTYIIYDINAYPFERILEIFSTQPQGHITLATYHDNIKTIITEEEIIQ